MKKSLYPENNQAITTATASHWRTEIIMIVTLMAIFGLVAVCLGQDGNWDLKNYHWYNAYSFLHHRLTQDFAPAQVQSYFNPLLDLVNYFIIKYSTTPYLTEFLLGTFHGIACYFLIKISIIVFEPHASTQRWFYVVMASLIGVTGVASISQIGTTFNEVQVSIFVMASLFIVMRTITNPLPQFYPYLFAGLLLGLSIGAKLTAFSYVIALFLALLLYKKMTVARFKVFIVMGICFVIGLAISDGFWMWKMFKNFHNPLFPFYNNIFKSPLMPPVSMKDARFLPTSFINALYLPFLWVQKNVLVQEAAMRELRFAATFILGLLWMFKWSYYHLKSFTIPAPRSNNTAMRFLAWFFIIGFIVWEAQFSIYRYTIPLNFLTGILIVYFCSNLFQNLRYQNAIIITITAIILCDTSAPQWDRVKYHQHYFEIQLPKPLPSNALIILFGGEPMAYIIPQFPASNRFIGLDNNLINLNHPVLYHQAIEMIKNYRGPQYAIMANQNMITDMNEKLSSYKIVTIRPCKPIMSNLEIKPLWICQITREL